MKTVVSKTKIKNSFTIARYQDGNKWVAHNLTLDIVGVSSSKKKALQEMRELTEAQLSFAITNGMLKSINHPAPERFWKMVAERINTQIIGELVSQTHAVTARELDRLIKSSPVYDLGSRQKFA